MYELNGLVLQLYSVIENLQKEDSNASAFDVNKGMVQF
jgi:hypothetical protein